MVEKGTDGVYDFDALVVEPRWARVGGEKVDVSIMPVAVQMELAKFSGRSKEEIIQASIDDPAGELHKTLSMVSRVCLQSNPKFTVDFLMEHLDHARLVAFAQFVLFPFEAKAAEIAESIEDDDSGNGDPAE